jgi:hypothetical protein
MNYQLKEINPDMDVTVKDDQALELPGPIEAEPQAEPLAPLKEVLRDYNLDAISAHRIMDYLCYLSMERTDMREPGSKRMIFRREILALARRIEAQSELDRLFEEQARDLAEIEATGRQWLPPVSEEELLERMAEQERECNGL